MKFLEVKGDEGINLISLDHIVAVSSTGIIMCADTQTTTEHSYVEIRAAVRDAAGTSKSIVRVAPTSSVWEESK